MKGNMIAAKMRSAATSLLTENRIPVARRAELMKTLQIFAEKHSIEWSADEEVSTSFQCGIVNPNVSSQDKAFLNAILKHTETRRTVNAPFRSQAKALVRLFSYIML